MKNVLLDLPSLALVVSTRAALAAGIGLLVSSRFAAPRRRAVGATLVAIGVLTTIPAVMRVRRGINRARLASSIGRDKRLIGATRLPRKGDDEFI